jgi:hypothetical protein
MPRLKSLISACTALVTVASMSALLTASTAAQARATVSGNPNPVVSAGIAANGDRFVFWPCKEYTAICEAYYDSATRRWSAEHPMHVGQMDSTISVSMDADVHRIGPGPRGDPYMYLFFVGGAKENLYEEYWSGRWHGPLDLGMGPIFDVPSGPSAWWHASTKEAVAWMGFDDKLHYATSDNPTSRRSWHGPFTLKKAGNIASPPSVVDAGGGAESVWWRGENYNLYSASLVANGPAPYGPCDFGMGSIRSMVSVIWGVGVPITPEGSGGGENYRGAGGVKDMVPAKVSGNCPKPFWFGQYGGYAACWNGEGGKKGGSGLWCMEWALVGDPMNPVDVLAGPFKEKNSKVLGSAPSLGFYPQLDVCPSNTCERSQAFAFWQSFDTKEDLIELNGTTGKGPYNLGFGPLGELG